MQEPSVIESKSFNRLFKQIPRIIKSINNYNSIPCLGKYRYIVIVEIALAT